MLNSDVNNPIQVFTVSEIRTNQTVLDLTGVQAIRVSAAAPYSLNGSSAVMPAGVTAFARHIGSITFGTAQTVEIMA